MRAILVDDEHYSLIVLEKMLAREDRVEIVGSYTNPTKVLAEIEKVKPQLALLDIDMPEMTGMELGEQLLNVYPDIAIIYVTAYSEDLEAFEVNDIDYLLKPVNAKRLTNALDIVERRYANENVRPKLLEENERPILRLKSFRGFEIYNLQGEVVSWRSKKAKELFVYLWLKRGDFVSRDRILEDVFPDKTADRVEALLQTTLYQIRNSLRLAGFSNPIDFVNGSYKLNVETDSDAKQLREMLEKEVLKAEDVAVLLDLTEGEFIEENYPWLYEIKQNYTESLFKILDDYVSNKLEKNELSESDYMLEELIKLMLRIDNCSERAALHLIKVYGLQNKKREIDLFCKRFSNVLLEESGDIPGEELKETVDKYTKTLV